ncbi:hypothetical protein ROHU_028876 [Labeo rohita]|uniref:Uncharacterized protein n=1 Tax=Labeo rohita TaxID=84645 RepID=A0A498M0J0_LABRO|nr:hypothetical protein ROHU_028876 [Labeo rohita]
MEQSVVTGSGDLGTATATSIFGGARVPEGWVIQAGETEGEKRNPLQPKRWRVGAQQKACKSVAEVQCRLTKGEPVGRGHFGYDLHFLQLRACNSDTGVFADCFITGSVKGKKN